MYLISLLYQFLVFFLLKWNFLCFNIIFNYLTYYYFFFQKYFLSNLYIKSSLIKFFLEVKDNYKKKNLLNYFDQYNLDIYKYLNYIDQLKNIKFIKKFNPLIYKFIYSSINLKYNLVNKKIFFMFNRWNFLYFRRIILRQRKLFLDEFRKNNKIYNIYYRVSKRIDKKFKKCKFFFTTEYYNLLRYPIKKYMFSSPYQIRYSVSSIISKKNYSYKQVLCGKIKYIDKNFKYIDFNKIRGNLKKSNYRFPIRKSFFKNIKKNNNKYDKK